MKNSEFLNLKSILLIFGIGLAGGLAGVGAVKFFSPDSSAVKYQDSQPTHLTSYTASRPVLSDVDFTVAAEKCIDGVVHVKTKFSQESETDPFYQFFFGVPGNQPQEAQASGSGVIVSSDGYIVTNNHVVENSTSIEVVLNDRRSFEARLIGRDPSTDIALLKIDAKDITPVQFGNSDDLKVGEWVLAIGNPFNLTSTVTAGIVSAKARNINILDKQAGAIESFIQTDAAVNPGNSGGALVDINGKLVGINTAIASQTGNFAGYAFAVPVSIVQKVMGDLMEFGTVQRALLGIHISDVTPEQAKTNNLSTPHGIYVNDVISGGSADDAGMKEGDIILKVSGKDVENVAQLQEEVNKFRPGQKTSVSYLRDGKEITSDITFKNGSNSVAFNNRAMEVLGASFEEISKADLKKLGIDHGVKVADVKSGKFLKSGIRQGFVITSVNNIKISSIDELQKVINNTKGGCYIEGVYPSGNAGYYAFGL